MIPFGQLKSFAGITFTGVGAVSGVKSAWPVSFDAEYDTALVGVGKTYPADLQGVEAAPLKSAPVLTYEYVLLATAGLTEALAFKDVRQKWNTIYSALQGSYTWGTITGTSGQKGTLVVLDEDPSVLTTYSATARIMKPAPFQLVKGEPEELVVQLQFALLSDFA